MFNCEKLCYSINGANSALNGRFPGSASAGANGRDIPLHESFNIRWRYITKEKLSANMYRDREVCFIGILKCKKLDPTVSVKSSFS